MNFIFILFIGFMFMSCETLENALDSLSPSSNKSVSQSDSNIPVKKSISETNETPITIKNINMRADPDSKNWNIDILDTAKDSTYLSGVEKDVILEMNKARSDPKKYVELYIQPRLKYFSGKNYSIPGQITIVTEEGLVAINDCINTMLKMKSVGLLTPELGLSLGAKDHTTDQGKTGSIGHDGSDRSDPFQRINRYGGRYNTAGENIAYGSSVGREIVIELLVDDGVPNRGHRLNIMNKSFTQSGVAFGIHPKYRSMCVITYANGYVSK